MVMYRPSMIQRVAPVSGSKRMMVDIVLGIPFALLPGKLPAILIPAAF